MIGFLIILVGALINVAFVLRQRNAPVPYEFDTDEYQPTTGWG